MNWQLFFYEFFTFGILLYAILLCLVYLWIGLFSLGAIIKHMRKNSFTDYRLLATSTNAPSFSLLAPAYNESATIVENVRSLLSIHYVNLEIIIINDGSKDNSLQKLIDAYELFKADFYVDYVLPTKEVKGVYKSKNPAFKKLLVVDKENGGKADALNVGINIASNDYAVCIDVDCILEQDAILKLAKPFMEETDKRTIACGGIIRLANDCRIENGKLVEVKLPKSWLARSQALEYIRAFLLGRLAWSRANGLLLISGAFGAFDKEIILKAGGYDHGTVGEDMELVVRMRRYMEEQNEAYRVVNIPDPLCWTEAPDSFKILSRQRNRWMRGTIETLWKHKKLFLNPKYGITGLISYPYWFLFEFLGPIIEFIGFIGFFVFLILGLVDWPAFFILLGFVMVFGVLYSIYAILVDTVTYRVYRRNTDVVKLVLTAILEPFLFHPFVVLSAVRGLRDYLLKKKAWGDMTRRGFNAKQASQHSSAAETSSQRFNMLVSPYINLSIVFLGLLLIASFIEFIVYTQQFGPLSNGGVLFAQMLFNQFLFWLSASFFGFIVFYILRFISSKWALIVTAGIFVLILLVQTILVQYFLVSLVPLGADIYSYSSSEIKQTIGSSGAINVVNVLKLLIVIFVGIACFSWIKLRKMWSMAFIGFFFVAGIGSFLVNSDKLFRDHWSTSDFEKSLVTNKSNYFYRQSYLNYFPGGLLQFNNEQTSVGDMEVSVKEYYYLDPLNYPFLRVDETEDVLSPFFRKSEKKPNIIILLMEGFGRAFVNEGAYLGNFTPFLDSLAKQGLYWENCLSAGGRTFAALPSVLASLPFGEHGFLELGEQMPLHYSLLNVLQKNGYHSSFYYGGDASFDHMDIFLKKNDLSELNDGKTFPPSYKKLPASNDFSWGYDDQSLFNHFLKSRNENDKQPQVSVLLSVSTHNPFLINNPDFFAKRFDERLADITSNPQQRIELRRYALQLTSVLNADDALRSFFMAYRQRNDYNQTIFIITGDHRMPEIPMRTKIDRYHVPLIIYSPLLKRTAKLTNIVSHLDITPSLLRFLNKQYSIQIPENVTWLGNGLDTLSTMVSEQSLPLMQTKSQLIDFVMGKYHLNEESLYMFTEGLDEEVVQDSRIRDELRAAFHRYKEKNDRFIKNNSLLPDSLLRFISGPLPNH